MFTADRVGMWDASIDYLRLTHRKGHNNYEVANRYARAVGEMGRRGADDGEQEEAWNWRGYRGQRLGHVAWGEHDAGFIFQASGGAARGALALRLPYTNVPRLDIQITYWLKTDAGGVAAAVGAVADAYRPKRRGRRAKVRHISGYGDGDTTYIGSRGKKSKFLRCYDKWREANYDEQYRHAWRFEAELTDQHAALAFGSLGDLPKTHHTVYALVSGFYQERGCTLPNVDNVAVISPDALPIDAGNNERRLRWLRHQVAPTVEKLWANGVSLDEVVRALGLTREDVLRAYINHAR